MKRVVFFSGGISSWAAARRVADEHGTDDMVLLFTDTLIEDEDTYRFLEDAAADIGVPITRIADGRDPWDVFFDVRFLANTRIDPCSRILKRELAKKWVEANCDAEDCILYLGLDWMEPHRVPPVQRHWFPFCVEAPLTKRPLVTKQEWQDEAERRGIKRQRLYALGHAHANCGGFCVKAGQAQFRLLYHTMPKRYAYHEGREQELREFLGKDVAILRDRTGGETKPMTMREFRERLEAGDQGDLFEWGGCGCFSDVEPTP